MISIPALSNLRTDVDIPEWIVSDPLAVPYLADCNVPFILNGVDDDERPEDFVSAVARFVALTVADRDAATPHVYRNFTAFRDAVGPDDVDITVTDPRDIWKHVNPTAIHVSRRHRRDRSVYVQIVAECDWEVEHGLQIVLRDGHILSRVSDQDGHLTYADAYDVPEEQDRIM